MRSEKIIRRPELVSMLASNRAYGARFFNVFVCDLWYVRPWSRPVCKTVIVPYSHIQWILYDTCCGCWFHDHPIFFRRMNCHALSDPHPSLQWILNGSLEWSRSPWAEHSYWLLSLLSLALLLNRLRVRPGDDRIGALVDCHLVEMSDGLKRTKYIYIHLVEMSGRRKRTKFRVGILSDALATYYVSARSALTDKAYTNAIVYECTVSESQWESSAGRPRRKRR